MQPIKEYGGANYFFRRYDPQGQNPRLARVLGNTQPGDGAKYAGRGYVQLTGRANYVRAGAKLGVDLVNNPDLVLDQAIAANIMRQGMRDGWFTGKSFQSYLPASGAATVGQFTQARRIINGTDCAAEIAGYAMKFQTALQAGGWA
jgi:predicted chitinase